MLACKFRALKDESNNKPKVVSMLSTVHNVEIVYTGKKDKHGVPIMKPTIINDYNHHMGGVDLVDPQLHYLHVLRKSYQWYKKVVFRLLTSVEFAQTSSEPYRKLQRFFAFYA